MVVASTGARARSPQAIYSHLVHVIPSERFLKMQGLGAEVPFFICAYRPEDAVEMAKIERQVVNKLEGMGVQVLTVNLYHLCIELLQQRGIWDEVLAVEEGVSKAEFMELLQGVLDPEHHLVPAIAALMQARTFDVMFVTGVGAVFPYIRSHNVLNNLQSVAKDRPTLLFFPGTYTHSLEAGASLDLFGRLHDDKYYRAFNIFHIDV